MICSNCGPITLSPAQQFGGKLAGAAAAAMLGVKMTKEPVVGVLCALVGLWIGHEIDKRCPQCGDNCHSQNDPPGVL